MPYVEATIRTLAARQHGVVARAQLVAVGVPAHAIEYRLRHSRMQRLHRGVYRVGPLPMPYEKEAAALLACGEAAVLSHRSAASLLGLLPAPRAAAPVDVSLRWGCRAPGTGVSVHHPASLTADQTTVREGLPVTGVPRTLLDLAGCTGAAELEGAVARAERERLMDREELRSLLERHPRHRRIRRLRALVASGAEPALTRSKAEARFLDLIITAGLPRPETNVVVHRREVDFLWRVERLVVEVDGFEYHSSRHAFEQDRLRDAVLTAAGLRVMRVTWRQLVERPEALVGRVAGALASAA